MIPSAAGSTDAGDNAAAAWGKAASMASTGRRQPMTPVELGNTAAPGRPSSSPAAADTRSAAATPSGAQTLATLVLTTTAPTAGSSMRRRPTITGAPGKALRVNTPAKSGVG